MKYYYEYSVDSSTKSHKTLGFADIESKINKLERDKLKKEAKNVNLAQYAVIVENFKENNPKIADLMTSRALQDYTNRPVSKVDPNEAFRRRKSTLSRISNELEWLSKHPDE